MQIYKTEMFLPEEAVKALSLLHGAGYEAYIIGGAVRSHVMGLPAADFDIVTNASSEAICGLFPEHKVVGKAFEVVLVTVGNKSFEVARYRTESGYTDGRHPDEVVFETSIKEDIRRRDFTCNALYYDYQKREVVDLTSGLDDIKNKVLRCIGDPVDRLVKEDCLRILRAVRLATQLDFSISKSTLFVIRKNASHILRISTERIQDELNKILLCKNAYRGVKLLAKTNLLQAILPEVALCVNFGQHNPYHQFDLFEHTAQTIKGFREDFYKLTEKEQLLVKLSLLLHDTGKPYKCMVKNYKCTYGGHPDESEKIAIKALIRLKYSDEIVEKVALLVKCHDYEIPATSKACKKLLNTLGEELFELWRIMKRQDVKAHSSYNNVKPEYFKKLKKLDEICDQVKNGGQCFKIGSLKIKGSDLIEAGYSQGAEVGLKLKEIFEAVLNEELENDFDELLKYAVQTHNSGVSK